MTCFLIRRWWWLSRRIHLLKTFLSHWTKLIKFNSSNTWYKNILLFSVYVYTHLYMTQRYFDFLTSHFVFTPLNARMSFSHLDTSRLHFYLPVSNLDCKKVGIEWTKIKWNHHISSNQFAYFFVWQSRLNCHLDSTALLHAKCSKFSRKYTHQL